MKRKMMFLSILPFCLALLLALSSCVDDQGKETPAPSDDPSSVEIDDQDIEGGADGEYNSDIVVTPKDPDMDIVVTPKDPNTNITILPGDEAPAPSETATPTPTATPSPPPTPKPTQKPAPVSTPKPTPTPAPTSTPTPTSIPTPSAAPTSTLDIDTAVDVDVDIEADVKGSADISLEDRIGNSSDTDMQAPGDSVQIGDIEVTPKNPGEDVVVTPKE